MWITKPAACLQSHSWDSLHTDRDWPVSQHLLCISMNCKSEPFCSPATSPTVLSLLEHFCRSSSNCSFSFLIWREIKVPQQDPVSQTKQMLGPTATSQNKADPHQPQIIHSKTIFLSAYYARHTVQGARDKLWTNIKRCKLQNQVSQ